MTSTDDFLAHYGVMGMKWGKRKASASSDASSTPAKKLSRGEKRQEKKQAQFAADQAKAKSFLDVSLKKGDKVLINLNGESIVTGKEFVSYLSSGGAMNLRTTRVFAEQEEPDGAYVMR